MGLDLNKVLKKEYNYISVECEYNYITSLINFNLLDKLKIDDLVKKDVYLCLNNFDNFLALNVLENIKFIISKIDMAELKRLLKVFYLDEKILYRTFINLSVSEKKKISLIIAFLSKNTTIIFENPSNYLDDASVKKLIIELKRFKRERVVIIESNNTELLLQVSDKVALLNNNGKVVLGNKYEILSNKRLLSSVLIPVPNILQLINLIYEKKNIKIGYRDNLNDTIKDIYRNV